jgi:hypothetical protein
MFSASGFVVLTEKIHLAFLALAVFAAFSARICPAQFGLELDLYGGDNTGGNPTLPDQAQAAFSSSASSTQ